MTTAHLTIRAEELRPSMTIIQQGYQSLVTEVYNSGDEIHITLVDQFGSTIYCVYMRGTDVTVLAATDGF